jgi:hypothetical protein
MKPRNKYGNKKVVVDGETYDSMREYKRWSALCGYEQAGLITNLERQVTYVLAPSVKLAGEKRAKPALRYVADFKYLDENGQIVVEDAKGHETDVSRIKRHLMQSVQGISVVLV